MPKPIRLLVVVSDLHCGSTYGLLPPDFDTSEGNRVEPNAIQRWLWECWTDATTKWLPRIVGKDAYAIIGNGDLVEGCHHGTKEVISPDEGDHVDAAVRVMERIRGGAEKLVLTEGTECHSKKYEHYIAKALGATKDPDTGKWAHPRADITIAGTRTLFQHHVSTTSRPYLEASGMGIALGVEQLEAAKNGERIPTVLGCAHRHRYGEFADASGLCFVTPPWQMLTRHGRKVVPSARTRPGLVVLDWRNRDDGAIPERHVITYRTPVPKGLSL